MTVGGPNIESSGASGYAIVVSGLPGETNQRLLAALTEKLAWISQGIDLRGLEGVGAHLHYEQALRGLDRGFGRASTQDSSSNTAIESNPGFDGGRAIPVLRDGQIKSHIILNAPYMLPLRDQSAPGHNQSVHLLAHECAHAEVIETLAQKFAGELFVQDPGGLHASLRRLAIMRCWNEYGACWIAASYGEDPTLRYELNFQRHLEIVTQRARDLVADYRNHANLERVLIEVHLAYARLMVLGSYLLGALNGTGRTWRDLPGTAKLLSGSWYAPYFERLDVALADLAAANGTWVDLAGFQVIADIADELMNLGGVCVEDQGAAGLSIRVS